MKKENRLLTIDGENVIENGYWAYHLDESSREARSSVRTPMWAFMPKCH